MHLSPETALDLIEGRLQQQQQIFWNQHIQACSGCKQDLGRWREFGIDLKRSHLQSAPQQDLEKAIHTFPSQPQSAGLKIRQVLAAMIFDSLVEPALAGARGAAAEARQLVLRAEEFDIHVKIWGEPEHKQMLGQLLPRTGQSFVQSARFHLLRNGERLETTATDETGEFRFTNVPDGDLSLQIDLPNLTVIGALNMTEVQ